MLTSLFSKLCCTGKRMKALFKQCWTVPKLPSGQGLSTVTVPGLLLRLLPRVSHKRSVEER